MMNPNRTPRRLHRGLAAAAAPLALSMALVGAHAAGSKDMTNQSMSTERSVSALVIMPSQVESDPGFANGCWVRLYDGTGFQGDQLTLMGPIRLPHMTRTGASWSDWDSAIVGPKARVTVFGGDDFKDPKAGLEPNQRIADMTREGFGTFANVNSVQVNCSTS